jgi:hypothetical protein
MEGSLQVHPSVAHSARCILALVGPRTCPDIKPSVSMFSTLPPTRNVTSIHIFVSREALYFNLIVFTSLQNVIYISEFLFMFFL